jgi:hypothetical protein
MWCPDPKLSDLTDDVMFKPMWSGVRAVLKTTQERELPVRRPLVFQPRRGADPYRVRRPATKAAARFTSRSSTTPRKGP